jgi:hypothetical protein
MGFVEVPIIELEDILLSNKLEQACKNISTSNALESLHDPEKF